jgi:hypothetical protein
MKDHGSASVMENGDFLSVLAWRRLLLAAVKKAIGLAGMLTIVSEMVR